MTARQAPAMLTAMGALNARKKAKYPSRTAGAFSQPSYRKSGATIAAASAIPIIAGSIPMTCTVSESI